MTEFKKYLALVGVFCILALVLYALLPYLNGIFGAFILFVLTKPIYDFLVRKTKMPNLSAALIIILTFIIIVLPFVVLASVLVGEVQPAVSQVSGIVENLQGIDTLDFYTESIDIENIIQSEIANLGDYIRNSFSVALKQVFNFVLSIIIMYFTLFYMLKNPQQLKSLAEQMIPFNKKNSAKLMHEFTNVTNSVVISTGIIAVLQGLLLGIAFFIFGIEGAAFWGFIGVLVSFLPVVGAAILWLPAALYLYVTGSLGVAIGMIVFGLFISNFDNFLRPVIQKKIGQMHPFITFMGVIIGIPLFSILGLIIGPLLLLYVYHTIEMFKEEYSG